MGKKIKLKTKKKNMGKKIKLTESDLHNIVKQSVKRILKEASDEGWEVDDSNVQEAYDFGVEQMGEEELNAAIVRCLGREQLAEALAFIFRQYNLTDWKNGNDFDNEEFVEEY